MFTRILKPPKTSILLLGPRGTGKSTWIRQHFPQARLYDLLDTSESLRLSKAPSLLYQELQHLPPNTWVVIDEVQMVPNLLHEVQRLMETRRLRFILSGSSARKLKRGGTNLLAGRARMAQFFPLVSREVDFRMPFPKVLETGTLPVAFTTDDPPSYLRAYASTYLNEEIKAEALARNFGSFARFLEVAARQNGQVTNVTGISRDAQVARQTVEGYFEILQDTLIGYWLPTWKLKRATKQIAHPKFYFFDAGIARALSGRLPYPAAPEEHGALLETFILNELRAYMEYSGKHYPLFFWSSPNRVEVDIFFETDKGYVAIECKASNRWESRFSKGLHRIQEEIGRTKVKCLGVFLGAREITINDVRILPALTFLKQLWADQI